MFIISVVRLQLSSNLNNVYIKHPVSLEQYIMEGSCAEAGRMLNLSGSEMTEFARKRDWKVMGERFVFRSEAKQEEGGVPSLELANMVISYAREMDELHTASYWWSASRGTQQGPCHPREQHPCRWLCQPGGGDHVQQHSHHLAVTRMYSLY